MAKSLQLEVVRELGDGDLEMPRAQFPAPTPRGLGAITALHHAKAKLIAQGRSLTAVAAALGCGIAGLKTLLEDPTFQELVSYYKTQVQEVQLATAEKAAILARQGLDLIGDRLERDGDKMPIKTLAGIVGDLLDRTDLPRKLQSASGPSAPTVMTFNFGKLPGATSQLGAVIDGSVEDEQARGREGEMGEALPKSVGETSGEGE